MSDTSMKTASSLLIPINSYRVGEAFIHLPYHRAAKRLESDQARIDGEIAKLTGVVDQCERDMKVLKVALYARFGNAINLDE
jgi:prefoldin subunit 4